MHLLSPHLCFSGWFRIKSPSEERLQVIASSSTEKDGGKAVIFRMAGEDQTWMNSNCLNR